MLRLANRTTRATAAGLLGLLVAAPPPSWADDDGGKRSRDAVARHHPGGPDDREPAERNQRRRDDHGRNHRRDLPAPAAHQGHGDRNEHRRGDRDRDHGRDRVRRVAEQRSDRRGDHHEWREDSRSRHDDHRDEWREDRHDGWRDDHRDEWRERQRWNHASYQGRRWHWHGDRWCPPGHRQPPGRRVGWWRQHDDWRWARYRRPAVVHSQYYCAPCTHWYGDRYAFDRHVYGYHQLPQLAFGDAVAQLVWGLVYFGP